MAVTKTYTRNLDTAGRIDKIQSLTQASTATRINNYGVTTIANSSANNTFVLNAPVQGLRKTIIADPNSTGEIVVVGPTTTVLFYGSTNNIATFSTGTGVKVLDLIGISATSWAIVSRTTGITLAASTLSA